jgi:anti-sigma B factor antagonist
MEFTYEKNNNSIIYHLTGNLIGEYDGIAIVESVNDKIGDGHKNFIMNMKDLQHINSTGLGVLITILTKARKIGGDVVLSHPSTFISNLLIITKLNSIFKVYNDLEEAKTAFA